MRSEIETVARSACKLQNEFPLGASPLFPLFPLFPRVTHSPMPRRAAIVFGIANLATAGLLAFGVFVGLPGRWWVVDVPAAVLVVFELASGVGLLGGQSWAAFAARVSSVAALACGLLAVSMLAVSASWLAGVYGAVGRGGAVILALVAALVVPYAVILPSVELMWLRRGPGRER
ncbi:MAG: hypothetical protein M3O50_05960 [Myxococcota bacterium]|nr:hypothetical protein [Myxococcota bacterium]